MFRLFLPTIVRELRSLTKVTLVIYVYDGNGMMACYIELQTCCHRTISIVNIYHKSNFSQTTQLPDDGWKKQPKYVGEL